MYESVYDIIALGMRYLFIVLIAYILLRLVLHSLREYRAVQEIKQKVRSVSPGYLEVIAPYDMRSNTYPLRRENTVGRAKRCDIVIDHPTLAPTHAFLYEKKGGLHIAGYGSRGVVLLNGERLGKNEELLYTADTIGMGAVILKLHLRGDEDDDGDGDRDGEGGE